MTEIQKFNFAGISDVRVIIRDGDPWFVAKDVCDVLGLGNVSMALSYLDDDEKAQVNVNISSDDVKRGRDPYVINEPGLYSLILRSRKERAREFKRWVTHEVLPTIRRTGGAYVAPGSQAAQSLAADPQSFEQQVLLVVEGLRSRLADAENRVAALKPLSVGAAGAEERKGGEPVWNLRDAIADRLGLDVGKIYPALRMIGAVEQRKNGYYVKPAWSDLLFDTEQEVNGKTYKTGTPRIRPGKQEEFLERVTKEYALRFGVIA
ncbi:MAG: hypothetical protein IRZ03_08290 [Acidobacterium ailaaui]|nr:hypothetical protein [Pseudacidobacterium ailaaui]